MCTNGVNTGQFEQMIDQIDDHIKLERRWAHTLGHSAGDAGFTTVSEKLHAAQALLDDVRSLLGEAKDALEDDAENTSNVTVSLV
ncbi:MAG: dynein gamma chain protein [Gordonibacter sp.]|uniref:dynein gamma chain protein n=1 Tax=Gordonibacter sp. TaxID=1968902 RepID=UPI002FC9EF62